MPVRYAEPQKAGSLALCTPTFTGLQRAPHPTRMGWVWGAENRLRQQAETGSQIPWAVSMTQVALPRGLPHAPSVDTLVRSIPMALLPHPPESPRQSSCYSSKGRGVRRQWGSRGRSCTWGSIKCVGGRRWLSPSPGSGCRRTSPLWASESHCPTWLDPKGNLRGPKENQASFFRVL